MYSIAICDDDKVFSDQLYCMLENYLNMLGIDYQIVLYNNIENISYDFSDGIVFDILFLDIEFPKEENNGIYLGHYLRKLQENDYTEIVYVSSKEAYAMQLFEIRPFDFLIKPLDGDHVRRTMDKMLYLQNINRKTFTYCFNAKKYCLELGKILYFESVGRKINIVSSEGGVNSYNGKISDIIEELKANKFFSPHKSYVVNYYAVEQWSRNKLTMINGDTIPVSRNKATEIHNLQLKYEME